MVAVYLLRAVLRVVPSKRFRTSSKTHKALLAFPAERRESRGQAGANSGRSRRREDLTEQTPIVSPPKLRVSVVLYEEVA